MQTAIDRLHLGKEQEVDIYDFDGYKQENRFVCPECGEYVFPAVGKRNGFRHYKKKDVECDRRVDGQASCTYYERVGLPLYLQKNNSYFELKIGFAPLNENLLNLAAAKRAQVIVSSGLYYSEASHFYIDNIGFSSDTTTFKTLDFTPYNDRNYKLSISDNSLEHQLLEHWSGYADGFTSYGALFSYSENGGKKVHRNDTIEANTTYYWMIPKGYFKARIGLVHKYESSLSLRKKDYEIYSITVQYQNEKEFSDLANLFWNYLKVRLLYAKPEIIPLWPPVIQTEQYNLALKCNPRNAAIFCNIKSDNDEPTIYRYFGKEYSQVSIYDNKNHIKWANLVLSQSPLPFTIDRKYLANSIMLCQKAFSFPSKISDVLLLSTNGNAIPLKSRISIDKNCKELEVKSSKRIDVICWNRSKSVYIFEVDSDKSTSIKLDEKYSEVWIIDKISKNIISKIVKEQVTKSTYTALIDDDTLFKSITKHVGEPAIRIPRKYKCIIHAIKRYPMCYSLLATNIFKGEIQPAILKIFITGGLFNE